jgi:hypothetical protein
MSFSESIVRFSWKLSQDGRGHSYTILTIPIKRFGDEDGIESLNTGVGNSTKLMDVGDSHGIIIHAIIPT